MIAPLAKLIDWSAIQVGAMLEPPPNGRNPRLEEALQFLKGPDFITLESQPAEVEFNPDKSGVASGELQPIRRKEANGGA